MEYELREQMIKLIEDRDASDRTPSLIYIWPGKAPYNKLSYQNIIHNDKDPINWITEHSDGIIRSGHGY